MLRALIPAAAVALTVTAVVVVANIALVLTGIFTTILDILTGGN
jgi:hypothetical protein